MRVRHLLGLCGGLLLWIALFVFARVQGAFFAWFLFYFVSLLFVYEGAVYRVGLRGLQVHREVSALRLSAGQALHLTVTLTRRSWWPLLWVRVQADLPQRWVVHARGSERVLQPLWAEKVVSTYKIGSVERGVYRVGASAVETGDLFGLVRRRSVYDHFDEVLVFPRVVPVQGWTADHPEEQGLRQPTRRRAEESSNVLGVRAYVPGDRLSRIHWPATARRGELQAKEFELHVTSELLFIVDVAADSFAIGGDTVFETEMTMAASLIKHAFELHRQFALKMHGERVVSLPTGRDEALFFRCMEELALARPSGNTPFSDSLQRMAREAVPGTTLVLVSPTLNRDSAAAVGAVRHRAPVEWFMPVANRELTDTERQGLQMLTAAGGRVHLIQSVEDLASLRRGGMYRATNH